jgi:16S rRNA (guanine527-N7)-methyltransferase
MQMSLNSELSNKFKAYEALLLKWQKSINLVSPSTLSDIQNRHILDSYQLNQYIPDTTKTIYDLGSGAGFPAMVLACLGLKTDIHCFESDQRKCEFLKTVSREIDIPVVIHMGRIESFSDLVAPDLITARALASVIKILNLTEFWRSKNPDLIYLLPKGETWADEIEEARQYFEFDIKDYPSQTDDKARILLISGVKAIVDKS